MPITAAAFRKEYLTQIYQSIYTGLSTGKLLSLVEDFAGQKHIDDILLNEYSEEDENWPIESLRIDAVVDYLDVVNLIDEGDEVELSTLVNAISHNNSNKQLRNLDNLVWQGIDKIEVIDVGLVRLVLDRIESLIDYLGSKGVANDDGNRLSHINDWNAAYQFVSSIPVSDVCLDTVFAVVEHVQKHGQLSAVEFLESFPQLLDQIDLVTLLNLLPFAQRTQLLAAESAGSSLDNYAKIVDKIVNAIQEGTDHKWIRPWINKKELGRPKNFSSKKKYKGINTINLWIEAKQRGYDSNYWASANQWGHRGYHIKQGEIPALVFGMFKSTKNITDEVRPDSEVYTNSWRYKSFEVFNACQLVDYKDPTKEFDQNVEVFSDEAIDSYVNKTQAIIKIGGNAAYYSLSGDYIKMPPKNQFMNTEQQTRMQGYYSTLLHELVHWTANDKRLNRKCGQLSGDNDYAFEELVAELGSAFLCADFGLLMIAREDIDDQFNLSDPVNTQDGAIKNHTAYIQSWVKGLKGNPMKYICRAASLAERAVENLHSYPSAKGE
ncbi:MAG: zincin-like metallopeptidase domain-containing protein [Methylococcaceae bacterium]|jgi:antirestriction protein ArdC